MNKNLLIGIGVFLAVVIAGFLLVPKKAVPPKQTAQNLTNVKEIVVTGTEYSYSPKTIQVNKGDNIKITFKNNGTTSHNLTIGDLGLATNTIGPGGSDSFEFTADKAGSFTFNCTIDGHKGFGMEGTLEVK